MNSYWEKLKQIIQLPAAKKIGNTVGTATTLATPASVLPWASLLSKPGGAPERQPAKPPEQPIEMHSDAPPAPDPFPLVPEKDDSAMPSFGGNKLEGLNLNLKPENNSPELEAAQRKKKLLGLIPEAIAGVGDAMATANQAYGVKGKTDSMKDVMAATDAGVAELKTNANEKSKTDPSSNLSKQYQAVAAKAFELMGKKVNPADLAQMSAAQLEAVLPNLEKLSKMQSDRDTKMLTQEMLRQNKADVASAKMDKNIMAVALKMRSDPLIKELEKQGAGFDSADILLQLAHDGNTAAFAALGSKMARAMGEVGVLTDQDVKRYVTSPALARGIADKANIMFSGRPIEATQQELAVIAKAMEGKFKTRIGAIADHYTNLASANYGLTPDEARRRLNAQFYQSAPAPTPAPSSPAAPSSNDPMGIR